MADSPAEVGTTYPADDDPDLVAEALPFSLELVEGLLSHICLRAAGCRCDRTRERGTRGSAAGAGETPDVRARDYGLRGIETRHRGFAAALRADPKAAVRQAAKSDVSMLYWTAAALGGSAISAAKEQPDLIADQPIVEALIDCALAPDPPLPRDDGFRSRAAAKATSPARR